MALASRVNHIISHRRTWQINPICQLHWQFWDDGAVIFNAASGQTHFLSELGTLSLQLMGQQAYHLESLLSALAEHFDELSVDDELRSYLLNTLEELDRLGLIEPHSHAVS